MSGAFAGGAFIGLLVGAVIALWAVSFFANRARSGCPKGDAAECESPSCLVCRLDVPAPPPKARSVKRARGAK